MSETPPLTAAQRKWPNVPACYGWLSLDRRGDWRLQEERVSHHGLIAFLNQNYRCDAQGRWFVQNGPQQVFVRLACTPWVFRMQATGPLAHTGQDAGAVSAVYLDDEGSILLDTALGIGLLDDRDLTAFLAECVNADGMPAIEAEFMTTLNGQPDATFWRGMPLQPIAAVNLKFRFKFEADPQP